MGFGRLSSQVNSKYIVLYTKLLEGLSPHQIAPQEGQNQFFTNLFNLEVKKEYLRGQLDRLSKESCLGRHKPFLNTLFQECLIHARNAPYADVRKAHALETLSIVLRCILSKNLSGWEVMEVLGGGVSQSDDVFMKMHCSLIALCVRLQTFTLLLNDIIKDEMAPLMTRHQGLQVALIYMCSIGQLSPGAYFLRSDLFPSITAFIKSCNTERFVSEVSLLLTILANFHKSDAGRLNPYLKRIRSTQDAELMRKICWGINEMLVISIRSYKGIADDSVNLTFTAAVGSMFASLRSDGTLSNTELPHELFKNQPAAETVFLFPIFELLRANSLFATIITEDDKDTSPPLIHTILTLSSYILTHATSTSSPRSLSYASLSLHTLLALIETDGVVSAMTHPSTIVIPICRQRLPYLPISQAKRPAICALLDCCVLWLRHNIHKHLEAYCYLNCIQICHRVVWYLQESRLRLEYTWKELWVALLGLLGFLTNKVDSLDTTGGVEMIARKTMVLLELSLVKSDRYLPSPEALHQFIYELIRSASILKGQESLLNSLMVIPEPHTRQATWIKRSTEAVTSITEIVNFYEGKVIEANARTAKAAMGVVAREIETHGLYTKRSLDDLPQAPGHSDDILSFVRFGCTDGLALTM